MAGTEISGMYIIPEPADYFCVCHQCFWHSETSLESHMNSHGAKAAAGPKALQCDSCFHWFPSRNLLKEHRKLVGTHTFPDQTDFVDMAVEHINEQGQPELQMMRTRVLCVNIQGESLDSFIPKPALLYD